MLWVGTGQTGPVGLQTPSDMCNAKPDLAILLLSEAIEATRVDERIASLEALLQSVLAIPTLA